MEKSYLTIKLAIALFLSSLLMILLLEYFKQSFAPDYSIYFALLTSFFFTALAMGVIYKTIILPLKKINHSLISSIFTTSKKIRVPVAQGSSDEINQNAIHINSLLAQAEKNISNTYYTDNVDIQKQTYYQMIVENSKSAIVLIKMNGDIIMTNNSAKLLMENIGVTIEKNITPMLPQVIKSPKTLMNLIKASIKNNTMAQGEFSLKNHKSTHQYVMQIFVMIAKDTDGNRYCQVFMADISARRAEISNLKRRADYDKLTGLYNRHATEISIEKMLEGSTNIAVLLLDLNNFKPINDTYGHETGDMILQHVSNQFKSTLRRGDIAGRWGGDEFVIALKDVSNDNVMRICDKLLNKLNIPLIIKDDIAIQVGASIGISFYPQDSSDLAELISQADQAMYRVKQSSQKHDYCFYLDK